MSTTASARDRLAASARRLFSAGGYAATSTRALAAGAGCNVALIKHYYGSKEGLLRHVLLEGLAAVRRELESLAESSEPAARRLTRFVDFMVDHFDRHKDLMRIVERELMAAQGPLISEVRALAARNIGMLASILDAARREGRARDVDSRTAAVLLMGMLKFYFVAYPLTSRVLGKSTAARRAQLKRAITTIFLDGIRRRR